MDPTRTKQDQSPFVRKYQIGNMTYIVKAVVKDGVKEDAATKVRRLIRNDLTRQKSPENPGSITLRMQTVNRFHDKILLTCLSGCRNRRYL